MLFMYYVRTYVRMYVCIYVRMNVRINVCIYVRMHVCNVITFLRRGITYLLTYSIVQRSS